MKLFNLSNVLLLAPMAVCLAQTPAPKPATPAPATPKAAPAPAAAVPALKLEDLPGLDSVVLTIGDEKITRSAFERLINGLPEQIKQRAAQPGGKKQIAEQVAQLKAMAQEARKRGLDKTAESKELIAFQTDSVLANALYRNLSDAIKPDAAAAKTFYDAHKSDYETVTASHILIRFKGSPVPSKPEQKEMTEEEALAKATDIRKQILAGADFGKLALAESSDTQSAQQNGSVGEFSHGRMVPAFEEAAFKQKVGEVGEPVKTQFGYHIIRVDKHEMKTLDEVRPVIEKNLKPELAQKAVEDVRKNANVVMNDAYFAK